MTKKEHLSPSLSLTKSNRSDLRLRMLSLYLLFVIPVVIAALAFERIALPRLEAEIKASELALARAIAQETNTILDSSLQAVRQLEQYPEIIQADPAGMEEIFKILQAARPDVNLVYRLDANGIMLYHFPTGPGSTVGQDFSGRDYFQRARQTRNPVLSVGRISPTTNQPVATSVMPLYTSDGVFLGVVATNIKLQALSHALARIAEEYPNSEDFSVAIIDSSGQVIAHPDPQELLKPMGDQLPEITQSVLSGQSGNTTHLDQDNIERLYSYVPIPSVSWGVVISRPTTSAFLIVRLIRSGLLILIAVFLVFGMLFWLTLSSQVIQPLQHLAIFSQRVGQETSPITGELRQGLTQLSMRPDQIGHLSRSLERMEVDINARLAELATLLQTGAAVVSTLDQDTVLNRILEQVERLLQVKMSAIVALDEKQGLFRARASRGLSVRHAQALVIDPNEPTSVSLRAIRNGEPIQISDTEEDSSFRPFRPRSRAEGYRAILAVPLITQYAPPAALLVYHREPHVFTRQEINLLSNFANHAAMAIENAALYARSDLRLREQTQRLEALIQSLQEGLILENPQGVVLYANRRMGDLLQLPLEELIGSSSEHLWERLLAQVVQQANNDRTQIRNAILQTLHGRPSRQSPQSIEFAVQPSDQPVRYFRLVVFTVTGLEGHPIGQGQLLRDVTQMRELDRMKSSLIATVSHELRTPLASIKGYTTTLLAEDVQWDLSTQREFLEIISSETDRLRDLVQDLLDMSRIEAGNLTVSRTECTLPQMVERAKLRAYPDPGKRLVLDLPPDLPVVSADASRIEAVLRNLIENAAKYSPDGSPIVLSTRQEGNKLVVRVEDQGLGIPADKSQRVFESFYRIQDGLTRSTPGAGLGLAICQGFVRAHGGEIWLEPRARGTCVAFSLPLTDL